MANRLRIVGFIVQPQVMVDDGEHLTPLEVQGAQVPASQWPQVVELLAPSLEQLRRQVEGEPADQ
jgi:hypothetical protein